MSRFVWSRVFWASCCVLLLVAIACRQAASSSTEQKKPNEAPAAASAAIEIINPHDGDTVPEKSFVDVKVSGPATTVWVVIHPMQTGDYWVQQELSDRGNGKWRTQIHVGTPGPADKGKHFEVRAVADPKPALHEGKLDKPGWPSGLRSPIIEVIRGD